MEGNQLLNVWNEVTISGDGIGITLYSESAGDGARVEDETWFTFEELQSASGDIVNLNLSDVTADNLTNQQSVDSRSLSAGTIAEDMNCPDWSSEETHVEVVENLINVRADEYVIDGPRDREVVSKKFQLRGDKTVADVNPSYDEDEPVVIAKYLDGGKEYAFPRGRLRREV